MTAQGRRGRRRHPRVIPEQLWCKCGERILVRRTQLGSHIVYSFSDNDGRAITDNKCPWCDRLLRIPGMFTEPVHRDA